MVAKTLADIFKEEIPYKFRLDLNDKLMYEQFIDLNTIACGYVQLAPDEQALVEALTRTLQIAEVECGMILLEIPE
jgi:hypothetical protein